MADQGNDYTMAIYWEHLRRRGGPGDVVTTYAHRWLMEKYGLDRAEAASVRDKAHRELKRDGYIERVNVRGPYVRILK